MTAKKYHTFSVRESPQTQQFEPHQFTSSKTTWLKPAVELLNQLVKQQSNPSIIAYPSNETLVQILKTPHFDQVSKILSYIIEQQSEISELRSTLAIKIQNHIAKLVKAMIDEENRQLIKDLEETIVFATEKVKTLLSEIFKTPTTQIEIILEPLNIEIRLHENSLMN